MNTQSVPILDDVAQRSVRLVAQEMVARVRETRERLNDPGDEEGLHDFRVSVRRLRSWLLIQSALLDRSVPPRVHTLLRRLAKKTNPSRDDEVLALWLTGVRKKVPARRRDGVNWLLKEIQDRRKVSSKALLEEIDGDLNRALQVLDDRLPWYNVLHNVKDGARRSTFAAEMASLVRVQGAALRRRLGGIRSLDDPRAVHRTRIAGKKLRYLLEPIASYVEDCPDLIEMLKSLQDTLGDLHDGYVWKTSIEQSGTKIEAASVRANLRLLVAHAENRIVDRFEALQSEWLNAAEPRFFPLLDLIVERLEERGCAGMEIERKYLLSGIPEDAPKGKLQRIEQGYLPGKKLIERVRRIRMGRRTVYRRTVKGGTGLARIEVEEDCSARVFKALWPLTKGKRVLKDRILIADGGREWALDIFTDRELYLAEVELPSVDSQVEIPDWLAPYLVREITGESGFVNAVLAR